MGRALHRHLIARRETRPFEFDKFEAPKTPYWGEAEFLVALCGEEHRVGSWNSDRFIEEAKHVSCPQCRTKIARAALKARPADAAKLTLERDSELKGGFRYGQGWVAHIDGVPIAVLGYEEHEWRVYPYYVSRDDAGAVAVKNHYSPLTEEGRTATKGMFYRLPGGTLGYRTKEDALLACEGLRAKGFIKPPAQLLEENAEGQRANAVWAEEQRRKTAERNQGISDTIEGLKEILEKETLSNFQRQALMTAIASFEAKVKPVLEDAE